VETLKQLVQTIIVLFFLALPHTAPAAVWKEVSPQRVYSMLKEGSGLWLIDVRVAQAFEAAHIEGAVNIPSGVLAHKTFPRQKALVLVDNSPGEREARQAAEELVRSGHERVFVLSGGIAAWRRAGQRMVGEKGAWELARLMPDDLRWAMERKIPLRIIDLRSEQERDNGPLPEAGEIMEGRDLSEKLVKATELLQVAAKPGLADQLEKKPLPVIIFPAGSDVHSLYQAHFLALPENVRVMEGGYLTWPVRRERITKSTVEGCATCPRD
jgi:rhodanese-related sulfurtransferase